MSEPRRAASIALFSGNNILLIRRAYAPSAGHWTLPGGRLEPGETEEICIRREIAEELALELGAIRFVETHAVPDFRLTVFAARIAMDAVPRPNDEIAGWGWYAPETPLPTPQTDGLKRVLARARQVIGPSSFTGAAFSP